MPDRIRQQVADEKTNADRIEGQPGARWVEVEPDIGVVAKGLTNQRQHHSTLLVGIGVPSYGWHRSIQRMFLQTAFFYIALGPCGG